MMLRTIVPRFVLALALASAGVWMALNRDRLDPALIESSIRNLGLWSPLVHVLLFAVGTVVFVPGSIFGVAGGVLFGPLLGTVLNLIGAMLGATAAFLIARYVAADWVRRKAGGWLERLITGTEAEGWRFVAFVRLVPLFPFNLTNYAFGLTRIPLMQYVFVSLACMVPGTLAYAWLGHAGREALTGKDAAIRYGLIALAILAAIAFLPRLVRRLRGGAAPRRIDVTDLVNRIKDRSVAVIDVRGPDEFRGPLGHIAEARNVPVDELPRRLRELGTLRDKLVVLACRTDKRSAKASALLRDAGFRDISVLQGGMELWNQRGLPVEDRVAIPVGRRVP